MILETRFMTYNIDNLDFLSINYRFSIYASEMSKSVDFGPSFSFWHKKGRDLPFSDTFSITFQLISIGAIQFSLRNHDSFQFNQSKSIKVDWKSGHFRTPFQSINYARKVQGLNQYKGYPYLFCNKIGFFSAFPRKSPLFSKKSIKLKKNWEKIEKNHFSNDKFTFPTINSLFSASVLPMVNYDFINGNYDLNNVN